MNWYRLKKNLRWYRLVKRLRLHRVGTKLLLHSPYGKRETMTVEEARRILQAVYPQKESSCVLPATRNWLEATCDLTVIVPVYNNGAYIEECLRSVLEQETQYSVEVIVVNDGSTDDTAEKLNSFAKNLTVQIITQANGGVAVARNTALAQARGRYLLFLDGDDALLPGAVQALMHCADEQHAAIVEGGYTMVSENGKLIRNVPHLAGPNEPWRELTGFPCFKVIARELWDRLIFPPNMYYEDSIMAQVMFEKLGMAHGKAFGIEQPVAMYRLNQKGFSQVSQTRPCSVDTVWITDMLMRDRKTFGMLFNQNYYEHLLDMAVLSWGRTEMMQKDVRRAVFVMYRHYLFDHPVVFRTTQERQKPLERALFEGCFWQYELMCVCG